MGIDYDLASIPQRHVDSLGICHTSAGTIAADRLGLATNVKWLKRYTYIIS